MDYLGNFQRNRYFVTAPRGFESVLKEEIEQQCAKLNLPISCWEGAAGCYVEGDWSVCVALNLSLMTASRVLLILAETTVANDEDIYHLAKRIEWVNLFKSEYTFAVSATVKDSFSTNSMHVALKVKDGLCDYFTQKIGSRPNVDTANPDIKVFVRLFEKKISISVDTTGEPLSKRGYRTQTTQAPLSENLAHAMLRFSSWHLLGEGFCRDVESNFAQKMEPIYQQRPGLREDSGGKIPRQVFLSPYLQDPMCGSGTILIEAALSLLQWKPNARRESFSFFSFSCISERELRFHYKNIKSQILLQEKSISEFLFWLEKYTKENSVTLADDVLFPLRGSDMDRKSIDVARLCAQNAGVAKLISFQTSDAFNVRPHASHGMLITNAPYGERLGVKEDLGQMYRDFGDLWKQKYKNWNIWFLSGNEEALKSLGLRPTRKVSLFNGNIPCKFSQFVIY